MDAGHSQMSTLPLVARARVRECETGNESAPGSESYGRALAELTSSLSLALDDLAIIAGSPARVSGRLQRIKGAVLRAIGPFVVRQTEIDTTVLMILTNLSDQVTLLGLQIDELTRVDGVLAAGIASAGQVKDTPS